MPAFGNTQLKLLEKLCNVIAVSGDESEVRKIVLEEIKPYADEPPNAGRERIDCASCSTRTWTKSVS